MNVDDHAIDSLKVWYFLALREVISEHQNDLSQELSTLLSFKAAKAYEDAINILVDALYKEEYRSKERVSVVTDVKADDEMREYQGDEYNPQWLF